MIRLVIFTFTLPGTTIETTENICRQLLLSLFETGGLVLSQVCTITGLETHMVQNWVKRGFVSNPKDKKYNKDQFCRIVTINLLKDALNLSHICRLLSYINGKLDDESDDLISDSELYIYFIDLLFAIDGKPSQIDNGVAAILADYTETVKDEKARLEKVLKIMAQAYFSAELKNQAIFDINAIERGIIK